MLQRTAIVPFLVLALVLVGSGCGDDSSSDDRRPSKKTLVKEMTKSGHMTRDKAEHVVNSTGGATPTDLPKGWREVGDGVWAGPAPSGDTPPMVIVGPVSKIAGDDDPPESLDEFIELTESGNDEQSDGTYRRIGKDDVELLGYPGVRLEFRATMAAGKVHGIEYLLLDEHHDGYQILGMGPTSSWDDAKDDVERVIHSLEPVED
jgi:hypothetical protein